MTEMRGFAPDATGTENDSSANIAAFSDQNLTSHLPCAVCGNPNRGHFDHLGPFGEGYHEYQP